MENNENNLFPADDVTDSSAETDDNVIKADNNYDADMWISGGESKPEKKKNSGTRMRTISPSNKWLKISKIGNMPPCVTLSPPMITLSKVVCTITTPTMSGKRKNRLVSESNLSECMFS